MKRRIAVLAGFLLVQSVLNGPSVRGVSTAGDFVYVKAKVVVDPNDFGFASAHCPDGSRTIGAGGSMSDSNGENAWISEIGLFDEMTADLDTDEDDGGFVGGYNATSKPHTLTTWAVCLAGSDNGDVVYNRHNWNTSMSTTAHYAPVQCPGSGQRALGGGAGTAPGQFDHLVSIVTSESATAGGIRGAAPYDRDLTIWAACLPDSTPRSIELVQKAPIEVKQFETVNLKVMCPRGTHVASGGGYGGVLFDLLRSKPIDGDDRDSVPDDGWALRIRNRDDQKRSFPASAVCVGPLPV